MSSNRSTHTVHASTIESIKTIGESIGVSNLSDEACREVINDLTFTIKSLIQDSQKFARNSKRKKLLVSDVDHAIKFRIQEPVYGFNTSDYVPFRSASGGGRTVYYTEDQVVNLEEIISQNNQTVKIPNDIVLKAHWLAIEGVQPAIPENPEIITKEMQKKEIVEGVIKTKEKQHKLENVKVKQLMHHDISVEHQLYFKEITEAAVGSDDNKRNEALNSLSTDPGLHQLLPRLTIFISEGVRLNIAQSNMTLLIYLMRMIRSLIENKHLFLEKYLHELLPAMLSCVLSKQVCNKETDNHWALRDFVARLIGQIVRTYKSTIFSIQTKVIQVYIKAIKTERASFSTVYGALVGISELGNEVTESFVFPLVKMLGERVSQILDSNASSQADKIPAERLKTLILKIVCNVLKSKSKLADDELDYLKSEFGAYFGPCIHAKLRAQGSQPQTPNVQSAHQKPLLNPQSRQSSTTIISASRLPSTNIPQKIVTTNTSTSATHQNLVSQTSTGSVTSPAPLTPTSSTTQKVFKVFQSNNFQGKVQVINASNVSAQSGGNLSNPSTPTTLNNPSNQFQSNMQTDDDL